MPFFLLRKSKIWHFVKGYGRKALCTVKAAEGSIFASDLREGEILCTNCANLLSSQKPERRRRKWTPEAAEFQRLHKLAQEAEARGDYEGLPHTADIVAHIAAGRPVSELAEWTETGISPYEEPDELTAEFRKIVA